MQGRVALVFTCEHGGNRVPAPFAPVFRGLRPLLASHRGYDAGALSLALALSRAFRAPLVASQLSRLVVELNRSAGHPRLFSEPMRRAGPDLCARAFRDHYLPYRVAVREAIATARRRARTVVHVSVHSFTPVLDGVARAADAGLLYDPLRPFERRVCAEWQIALHEHREHWRVRRNYPYRGTSDGLTTALRREWPPAAYAGIELEISQALFFAGRREWTRARRGIVESLRDALDRVVGTRLRS